MVASESSQRTLAEVAPSLITPRSVAFRPVVFCTHCPPILRPRSTPPMTTSAGHTWGRQLHGQTRVHHIHVLYVCLSVCLPARLPDRPIATRPPARPPTRPHCHPPTCLPARPPTTVDLMPHCKMIFQVERQRYITIQYTCNIPK